MVPGTALRRTGARAGDGVWVTGTIGDGALGLLAATGKLNDPDGFLADRYRLPQPRLALGQRLAGIAAAAMDVSDGLVQDLGHLCRGGGLGAVIEAALVPLSPAARVAVAADGALLARCLGGGDDYELLFTVRPSHRGRLRAVRREVGELPITRIGTVIRDRRQRVVTATGEQALPDGFEHFR